MKVRIASRDDHAVGVHHEPDRGGRAVAQDARSSRPGCAPGAGRRRTPPRSAATRRGSCARTAAPPSSPASPTGTPSRATSCATSGNESSRSVSPVGAQSTMIASNSLRLVVALDLQQREQLVHARRHGQLLGRDAVHAAVGEQIAEPFAARPPSCAPSPAAAWTSWPQRLSATGVGSLPSSVLERVGQAVRRIGRQDDRAQPARPRSGARSPRPRSSCRLRPCPCRGSSAEPWAGIVAAGRRSAAPGLTLRNRTVTLRI